MLFPIGMEDGFEKEIWPDPKNCKNWCILHRESDDIMKILNVISKHESCIKDQDKEIWVRGFQRTVSKDWRLYYFMMLLDTRKHHVLLQCW